jgi:hypothetical protein
MGDKDIGKLVLDCELQLELIRNPDPNCDFPYEYYANLIPNDKSMQPWKVKLTLEQYTKLVDRTNGKGKGKVTLDFRKDSANVCIELYVG